jgi:SNF2 family DNA or RNA helicase
MYLLSDSRVKRIAREFNFYAVRFYREEKVPELTVCFDYPAGNLYWYVDFKKYVEQEILKTDVRYETEWKLFLSRLKLVIKDEFETFSAKLNTIKPVDVVRCMHQYSLRDYQAFDVEQLCIKMSQMDTPAGLILSEQRTGKTRVALATICKMLAHDEANVAIVCPKSAINSWVSEIQELNKVLHTAPFEIQVFKHMREVSEASAKASGQLHVKLISYDLFKRFTYAQLRKAICTKDIENVVLVVDEAHRLRNFRSLQSDALFRFKTGCLKDKLKLYILGLTGTPAVKGSSDVFGIFSLINTSKIGFSDTARDFNEFKEYFYHCEDTSYGKICKTLRRTHELNFLIQVCAVQTKQKDLPMFRNYDKKYIRIDLDMEKTQREIYTSVRDSMEYGEDIDCMNTLVQLTRLQQICIDPSALVASYDVLAPKIDWMLRYAKTKTVKTIVMAKKLTALKALAKVFDKNCIPYSFLNGSLNLTSRAAEIDRFKTDPSVKFILIQSDVGKESLTLPEATATIFLDREFAQGFNEQAESRMTPIDGMACTKYVIDLVMRDTVEEEIYNVLVIRKQNIATVNDVSEILKKGG